MKLAAIDIGSNAVRCQISNVLEFNNQVVFKKLEYIRYPIRFGEDVFARGYISDPKVDKFVKLMHSFKLLLEVHDVDGYMICATSAMRTAQNAPAIVRHVFELLDMDIRIIDGKAEAELINKAIRSFLDEEKHYLHIDVGGGSTEFNIYADGVKMASQSFELGSIRHMQGNESEEIWQTMKRWVKENAKLHQPTRAIGTGGNINKIFDLAGKQQGKPIFRKQIEEIVAQLAMTRLEDRINLLLLNPDRADVIVPAAEIYLSAMKWAKIESMLVPSVGLKDGMMQELYEQFRHRRVDAIIENN